MIFSTPRRRSLTSQIKSSRVCLVSGPLGSPLIPRRMYSSTKLSREQQFSAVINSNNSNNFLGTKTVMSSPSSPLVMAIPRLESESRQQVTGNRLWVNHLRLTVSPENGRMVPQGEKGLAGIGVLSVLWRSNRAPARFISFPSPRACGCGSKPTPCRNHGRACGRPFGVAVSRERYANPARPAARDWRLSGRVHPDLWRTAR